MFSIDFLGQDGNDTVMQKLIAALDEHQRIINRDAAEEKERFERERVMQEQVDEYEKSLAADRAKQEELRRQHRLEM